MATTSSVSNNSIDIKDDPTSETANSFLDSLKGLACVTLPRTNTSSCSPGFFCPNVNASHPPTQCIADLDCIKRRLSGKICQAQGLFEPTICLPGYYCPTQNSQLICPQGYYCLTGTTQPRPCPLLSLCPEGTVTPNDFNGIIACGVIDLLLLFIALYVKFRENPRNQKQPEQSASMMWNCLCRVIFSIVPTQRSFSNKLDRAEASMLKCDYKEVKIDDDCASFTSIRRKIKATSEIPDSPTEESDSLKDFHKYHHHHNNNNNNSKNNHKKFKIGNVCIEALKKVVTSNTRLSIPFTSPAAKSSTDSRTSDSLINFFKHGMKNADISMTLSFKNLGMKLQDGTPILQDVNGKIHAGRMTAIMGPSGAGKTTFMNVLMGKVAGTSGSLKVNGFETEMHRFKKAIGYVPQEDIMLRELTVRENILHSAKCRLPPSWRLSTVESYVDTIIEALNLTHVAHTIIGDENQRGVSGGQRKRVNIALELASIPLALFLDEPTSGLDSTAALQVCRILSRVSKLGIPVVSVIHQPRVEIFEKFDDVMLIVPGGKTVYFGAVANVQAYFEKLGYQFDDLSNPADVLMDILSGKSVRRKECKNDSPPFTPDELVDIWNSRNKKIRGCVTRSASENSVDALDGVEDDETDVDDNNVVVIVGGPEDHYQQQAMKSPSESFSSSPGRIRRGALKLTAQDEAFLTSMILSDRGAPFLSQFYYCFSRSMLQQFRKSTSLGLELSVGMFSGLMIGMTFIDTREIYQSVWIPPYSLMSPSPFEDQVSILALCMALTVSLAAAPAGVKIYGDERTVYWREVASGHNSFAYYLGKLIASLPRLCLSALHFAASFHFIAQPVISFQMQFILILLQFFGVYGLSSMVSMLVKRENATLLAAVASLTAAVFNGTGPKLSQARTWGISFLWDLSFFRWATEAQFSEYLMPYQGVYMIEETALYQGFDIGRVSKDVWMMVAIGVVQRVAAYFLLVGLNRDKQK